MREDIKKLLQLQSHDLKVRALEREREEKQRQLDSLRAEVAEEEASSEEERRRVQKDKSKIKELDLQIGEKQEKIGKYQQQQLQIKNNKEYQALLHEIEGLKADIRVLEDKSLEIMEEEEVEHKKLEEVKNKLKESQTRLEQVSSAAAGEFARIEREIGEIHHQRAEVIGALDPEIAEKYDRIFRNKPGMAIVSVVGDTCQGCNMQLTPQILNDLQKDDRLYYCENCGRLIYLPEE